MPNLFCVVCFKVQNTTKEMFVANVVQVALANQRVLVHQLAQGA